MQDIDATVSLPTVCALMVALAAKHYAADFVGQTEWMARGKERASGWAAPLAAHAGVHAAGTLAVVLAVRPALWWLAPLDFLIHGAIDRAKSVAAHRTRFPPADPRFWWLFGFDQFLHQATNVLLAGLIAAG